MPSNKQLPYKTFGDELKKLRSKASKSEAEVSGAVEIDQNRLKLYESGEQRPTEDILTLLIQHFDLKDEQADELWKLAGYNGQIDDDRFFENDEHGNVQQVTVGVTPHDARIVYTDMIQVMVNNYGVIVNFLQGAGPSNQPLAVSRVGMSKEHARSVIEVLQKTLDQADNPPQAKLLSAPNKKD
ncbi:MAG: transcriptional regulator with XRE-family HTH domain [Candidatus Saccharimonadales bacterium]|jgi:transcriptional regulator with XRE-family HTH domain